MLPLKPICERRHMRRDGTSNIYLQYCYSAEKRTLLNTEIAIPPAYWNKKTLTISKDLPSVFGDFNFFNGEIKRMMRLAEDIIDFAIQKGILNRGTFAKQTFAPHFDIARLKDEQKEVQIVVANAKTVNLDLFYQLDDYIQSKMKKVTAESIGVFRQMKEHLLAFQAYCKKAITFESLDYNFYHAFVEFLTFEYIQKRHKSQKKGLKINTVGKTIKQLRIFVKDRIRRKIILPIDLTDFKICEEEADAIYLNEKEIQRIRDADLSNFPYLIKYRELLVFGCLTGLRFSDFSCIQPEDVRGEKLFKKQEKSEHWVVIPLKKAAYEIFVHRFNRQVPIVTNPDFNYYIKEVGRIAGVEESITFSYKKGNKTIVETKPKYAWMTSHTCRRSFCTNEFLAGTPVLLIMKISGHKKEKDFYKYIRITAEEAALKIEKIWKERDELLRLANTKTKIA